jgi:hypothetical protein
MPRCLAKSTAFFVPTFSMVCSAGMFIEWLTASRQVTSPLNEFSKFCGFQDLPMASSLSVIGVSRIIVAGVYSSREMAAA